MHDPLQASPERHSVRTYFVVRLRIGERTNDLPRQDFADLAVSGHRLGDAGIAGYDTSRASRRAG